MPACCGCNGSGRCTNCCCKKAGRFCINCLPSRKNHCGNQAPSEPNRPYSGHSSSAENCTDTTDDLERTTNSLPVVTVIDPAEVPTLPPINNCNETQIKTPITDSTELLPPYTPVCSIDPSFRWGRAEGSAFLLKVDSCYSKVVHWQRSVFSIPSGKAGKDFVSELARLYNAYAEGSQTESFALTAAMILPSLILQKLYPDSKAKEHVKCIERRLILWRDGDIDSLLQECLTIQQHLRPPKGTPKKNLARSFANLVMQDKVKSALRLLSSDSRGTPLSLDKEITSGTGSDTRRSILIADQSPPHQFFLKMKHLYHIPFCLRVLPVSLFAPFQYTPKEQQAPRLGCSRLETNVLLLS